MNSKIMVDIFRKFGVVKDVYIPLKRRKVRNTRFAFARYDCEVAAEVAVQKANGIWMEDKQLVVKHARQESYGCQNPISSSNKRFSTWWKG